MEEINIKDLLNYLVSKSFVIVIIVSLAVLVNVMYGQFIKVPMYSSYTTIVLTRSDDKGTETAITQSDITLNQHLVSTYREIMKSRRVLDQVIDNLKLDTDVSSLGQRISVTSEQDTELIKITVSYPNSEDAKNIANEIAKVFSKEIKDIYDISNVSIIDKAMESGIPYNINPMKEIIISVLIGLIIGFVLVFCMFYFDTTIKSTEEVETRLGLPILGSVPKADQNNKNKLTLGGKK